MEITYFFRKPKFPIICEIDGYLIATKSKRGFEKQLSRFEVFRKRQYNFVDISGEGWVFHGEQMVVSPMTFKKRWTKKEIVRMFNKRENNFDGATYSEKSISAKRFDRIFREIVDLLI